MTSHDKNELAQLFSFFKRYCFSATTSSTVACSPAAALPQTPDSATTKPFRPIKTPSEPRTCDPSRQKPPQPALKSTPSRPERQGNFSRQIHRISATTASPKNKCFNVRGDYQRFRPDYRSYVLFYPRIDLLTCICGPDIH